MNKLFWIGSPFFVHSLEACGWEVAFHNFEHTAVFGWDDIVAQAGWEPDVIVVADKSRLPFVLGMESFPCLTVFYCVDSHIHSWYPLYAQGFDACLMSLKDHMPQMAGKWLPDHRIWWSPAFAKEIDRAGDYAPIWDVLFVGNVDKVNTPRRHTFLYRLKEHLAEKGITLQITKGNYRALYPQARIVLNFCEFGDLNFRVFEALGCGACLLTPKIGQGLEELFTDGEDLLLYPVPQVSPHDPEQASPDKAASQTGGNTLTAEDTSALANRPHVSTSLPVTEDEIIKTGRILQTALQDEKSCRRIAANGLQKVDSQHRASHRAQLFTDNIRTLQTNAPDIIEKRLHNAVSIRTSALRIIYLLQAEQVDSPLLKHAYLAAASGTYK